MWSTHFSQVFLQYQSLQVPWYSIPGNHDYGYGHETMAWAQGPARRAYDDLWRTPGTNYTVQWQIPGGGVFSGIFADSTTLSPATNKWTNENGGISTAVQQERIVDQANRLWEYYTAAVDAGSNWIFTFSHYPIYSCGDHGDNS